MVYAESEWPERFSGLFLHGPRSRQPAVLFHGGSGPGRSGGGPERVHRRSGPACHLRPLRPVSPGAWPGAGDAPPASRQSPDPLPVRAGSASVVSRAKP